MIIPGRDLRVAVGSDGHLGTIAPQSLGDLIAPLIECSEHSEECTEMPSPGRDLRLPWEGIGTSVRLLRNHSATLAPLPGHRVFRA